MGRAESRYRAVRLTVTAHPHGGASVVTVAVKQPTGRWDDWSLLFPALRCPLDSPSHALEVLEQAQEALAAVYRAYD